VTDQTQEFYFEEAHEGLPDTVLVSLQGKLEAKTDKSPAGET
jgi:hypothetical protein